MSVAPEFSRLHRLDQIGAGDAAVAIAASPGECAALARRFDLAAVEGLAAQFTLKRDAMGVIVAHGRVQAQVVQHCVATREPVPATIDEQVALRFAPEPADTADEVELSEDEIDTIFYTGGAIDLGEAAAETMALALDPFPRSAAADEVLRHVGVLDESEVRPIGKLGGLAGLKDLIEKG